MVVAERTVLFRDEIDLAATEAAHPYLVSAGAQVMVNRVFELLADVARAVTDDRIAQAEVTKVEFVIHLEQAASANVVARHLFNETGFLEVAQVIENDFRGGFALLRFQEIADAAGRDR